MLPPSAGEGEPAVPGTKSGGGATAADAAGEGGETRRRDAGRPVGGGITLLLATPGGSAGDVHGGGVAGNGGGSCGGDEGLGPTAQGLPGRPRGAWAVGGVRACGAAESDGWERRAGAAGESNTESSGSNCRAERALCTKERQVSKKDGCACVSWGIPDHFGAWYMCESRGRLHDGCRRGDRHICVGIRAVEEIANLAFVVVAVVVAAALRRCLCLRDLGCDCLKEHRRGVSGHNTDSTDLGRGRCGSCLGRRGRGKERRDVGMPKHRPEVGTLA